MHWMKTALVSLCYVLSVAVMIGTAGWLNGQAPQATVDTALSQARHSLKQYCAQHRLSPSQLKLVNATFSPSAQWQFDFHSARSGTIRVQVPADAQTAPVIAALPRS